ncbi:XkdX family protein [Clostridium tyrobutyricum]|nr:XkdX family protein [Clostridium tyrobutyricum]MBV4417074.1 XkdX family protein [Clostridium tyrobutyricum]
MLSYEFYKMFYTTGGLTIDDLKQAVEIGDLTADQFKEITGQDYIA